MIALQAIGRHSGMRLMRLLQMRLLLLLRLRLYLRVRS